MKKTILLSALLLGVSSLSASSFTENKEEYKNILTKINPCLEKATKRSQTKKCKKEIKAYIKKEEFKFSQNKQKLVTMVDSTLLCVDKAKNQKELDLCKQPLNKKYLRKFEIKTLAKDVVKASKK